MNYATYSLPTHIFKSFVEKVSVVVVQRPELNCPLSKDGRFWKFTLWALSADGEPILCELLLLGMSRGSGARANGQFDRNPTTASISRQLLPLPPFLCFLEKDFYCLPFACDLDALINFCAYSLAASCCLNRFPFPKRSDMKACPVSDCKMMNSWMKISFGRSNSGGSFLSERTTRGKREVDEITFFR